MPVVDFFFLIVLFTGPFLIVLFTGPGLCAFPPGRTAYLVL